MTITAGRVVISGGGGGMSNPMTTAGDLITGGASGTPGRLAVGAEGEVLTVTGGEPAWAAAAGGPSRVAFDLSSATGWTVVAGTGSAAIDTGAETADLGIPSATVCLGDNTPTISYPLAAPEEWEVRARLAELSGGAGGSPRAVLDVASAASGETGVSLVSVWVDASGNVELLTFLAGSGSSRGTISASLPRGGTGWVRVRRRNGRVTVYYGTGVGTAPPTVWRCSHDMSWAATDPTVAIGHVRARALHFGAASSTPVVVSWADISGVDLDAGTSVALSDATPAALGTAAAGVSTEASRADHVHALQTLSTAGTDAARPTAALALVGRTYTGTDTAVRYLCESDGSGGARWCVVGRHQYEGRDTTCARMGGTRTAASDTSTTASTIRSGAVAFSLSTLPTDAVILVSISAPNAGWQIEIGRDATSRGRMGIYAFGFGTPDVLFAGAVAAADNAMHCLAWTWDGVTARYSWDGATVATASHVSGTLTNATSPVRYGANNGGSFPPNADLSAVKLWSTAVGDAGLEAVAAAYATGRIPDVAGSTVVFDWHAARYVEGLASQVCVRGTAQRLVWSAAPPMVIR